MAIENAFISPAVERERLRAAEQVGGRIGTAPEDRFDQIIRVAKIMFEVPMSSISVIDDRHQWFKSVAGLREDPIPRELTMCQVTIARAYREPANPVYIVEDATTISDFACLPGVGGDDGVRFYAGHPLYGPGGHYVGVFCIYDSRPRSLNSSELKAFAELASWVQRELEQSAELDRAAQVQRELLPKTLTDIPGYEVAAVCVPAFAVGGDFYDHYTTARGAYFTVVDVMGKGIPAAILTASVRSALRGTTRALDSVPNSKLSGVIGMVSDQLADDFERTGSFATAFHSRLEPTSHTVEYVDAGQGTSLIRHVDGSTTPLSTGDLPLGVGTTWTARTIHLEPGAALVLCSDGLLDILAEDSDRGALADFLRRYETPADLAGAVQARLRETVLPDDVTLIAIRRVPQ
ncbi:MAG: SpoIIE family protein phosphatase [Nocardiaceae bacterium]|nr:SpoIIE family protein phosphatase [Nocardiaceae bacterium]